jgi:hypothetical protein
MQPLHLLRTPQANVSKLVMGLANWYSAIRGVQHSSRGNFPWNGKASQETINNVVNGIEAIIVEFMQSCPDAKIVLTGLFPRDQNANLRTANASINKRIHALSVKHDYRFINTNKQLAGSDGKLLAGYWLADCISKYPLTMFGLMN